MNTKELFQTNLAQIQNYQAIFASQLTNLTLFYQKLEELQYSSPEHMQDGTIKNLIDVKKQIQNVMALLIVANEVLNNNISFLKIANNSFDTFPDNLILNYLKAEEKVLSYCRSSCEKINASLFLIVTIIAKLKNKTDNPDLSR